MRWLVALIILAGIVVRVPGLTAPPLEFHPARQYWVALSARAYYLDHATGLSPQQVAAARHAASRLGTLEPPVLQYLSVWTYRLIGREDLTVPRAISVIAWALGALALAWLLVQFGLSAAAVVGGVAIVMFAPFAVPASKAVQPDSLMTALVVLAGALAVHYGRRPSIARFAFLTVAAMAALFTKPMAIFFVSAATFGALAPRQGLARGAALSALCAAVAVVPVGVYFSVAGYPQADYGLFTQLAGRTQYWLNWAAMLNRVAGVPLIAAAVVGLFLAPANCRWFLACWWAAYVLFGLAFAYRVSTHDYYSLPFIPVLAASAAVLFDRIDRLALAAVVRRGAVAIGVAAVLAVNARTVSAAGLFRSADDLRAQAARYEKIGAAVGHSANVISLDGDYGFPLNYHGFVSASNWPLSIDLALDRLAGRNPQPAPERLSASGAEFFVATNQLELNGQPELRVTLERQFPLVARDGTPDRWNFVVFDLRQTKISVEPERLSLFTLTKQSRSSGGKVALWSGKGVRWRVGAPAPHLFEVRPNEGAGPATLELVARVVREEIDRTVQVPIFVGDSAAQVASFTVRFKALGVLPGTPPYGSVDGPADPVTLGNELVTFQGWALDDFDLRAVWAGYADEGGKIVRVGDAKLTWMRPDVAAIKPNAHDIFTSGWVFVLEPRALERPARPVVLRFYAENGDGLRAEIGHRTIVEKR